MLWLTPPALGTKIMQAGQTAASICASCPAPLGSRLTGSSNSRAIASTRATSAGANGDRIETRERALLDRHALARGGLGDECGEAALGLLEPLVVGVAQIDRHHRALGDDVDEIGR